VSARLPLPDDLPSFGFTVSAARAAGTQKHRDERGRFVARVDLLFEEYREIFEYQGDHHRTDIRQWRRDISRKAEVELLDYHVTDVTAGDLEHVNDLLRRLERNLQRRGWTGNAIYDP
jgi:hypothetical protein